MPSGEPVAAEGAQGFDPVAASLAGWASVRPEPIRIWRVDAACGFTGSGPPMTARLARRTATRWRSTGAGVLSGTLVTNRCVVLFNEEFTDEPSEEPAFAVAEAEPAVAAEYSAAA